jgi:hypothetical protein
LGIHGSLETVLQTTIGAFLNRSQYVAAVVNR